MDRIGTTITAECADGGSQTAVAAGISTVTTVITSSGRWGRSGIATTDRRRPFIHPGRHIGDVHRRTIAPCSTDSTVPIPTATVAATDCVTGAVGPVGRDMLAGVTGTRRKSAAAAAVTEASTTTRERDHLYWYTKLV